MRLVHFLGAVYDNPFLAARLVLKGGTALNLYHADVPRLSVDADFNYVGGHDLPTMQADRPKVLEELSRIAASLNFGFRLDRPDKAPHAGQFAEMPFKGCEGDQGIVKLDLNFLDRVPLLLPVESKQPPKTLEIENAPVRCVQLDELAGMKTSALCGRDEARDLFDVAYLAGRPLNFQVVRKAAIFQSLTYDLSLQNMRPDRCEGLTEKDLQNRLVPLMRKKQIISRSALLAAAKRISSTIFPLAPSEKYCVDQLAAGIWNPLLLLDGVPFNPVIQQHPGILHRLATQARDRAA